MNRSLWRRMLLTFAVFMFCCLLVSGGSRLIAMPDEAAVPMRAAQSWMNASLRCLPAQSEVVNEPERAQQSRGGLFAAVCCEAEGIASCVPQTDANGNVLRQTSYMRAVYQVFALGDGFA